MDAGRVIGSARIGEADVCEDMLAVYDRPSVERRDVFVACNGQMRALSSKLCLWCSSSKRHRKSPTEAHPLDPKL